MRTHTTIGRSLLMLLVCAAFGGCSTSKKSNRLTEGQKATAQNKGDIDEGEESDAVAQGPESEKAVKVPDEIPSPGAPMSQGESPEPVPMNPAPNPADPAATPPPPAPMKQWSKIGIRNFEGVYSTMSALTGIPKTNPRFLAAYNANKGTLQTYSFAENLSNTAVVSMYKMASTICDELTKDATARTAVFGAFNFAGLPQVVLNDAGKKQVAEAIVVRFWGKDLAKLPPHEANITSVVGVIDKLLALNTPNTAVVTMRVVAGACTAALIATPAMSY